MLRLPSINVMKSSFILLVMSCLLACGSQKSSDTGHTASANFKAKLLNIVGTNTCLETGNQGYFIGMFFVAVTQCSDRSLLFTSEDRKSSKPFSSSSIMKKNISAKVPGETGERFLMADFVEGVALIPSTTSVDLAVLANGNFKILSGKKYIGSPIITKSNLNSDDFQDYCVAVVQSARNPGTSVLSSKPVSEGQCAEFMPLTWP